MNAPQKRIREFRQGKPAAGMRVRPDEAVWHGFPLVPVENSFLQLLTKALAL